MSGSTPLSATTRSLTASKSLRRIGKPIAIVSARTADDVSALHFLNSVFHGPSPGEFKASLEDPYYESRDRLLIKGGRQIYGHVQITCRAMHLGRAVIPVAGLRWLATAPEIRGRGLGAVLLRRAERLMVERGAAVGLLSTTQPAFFRKAGWIDCGDRNRWIAGVWQILAVLAQTDDYPKIRRPLDIRPVRRMEILDLARIYRLNTDGTYGPLERTEAYWHWLVNRKAYDEILVAIDWGKHRSRATSPPGIVGYAVLKAGQVLELMTAPDHRKSGVQLLCRACGEAIEQGIDTLSIHLAEGHSLSSLLQQAGAALSVGHPRRCEVLMAKLLCPDRMLQRLSVELLDCARREGLGLPLELGFAVENRKYQLSLAPPPREPDQCDGRALTAASGDSGSVGRSYLRLDSTAFSQLLLGTIKGAPGALVAVEASTKLARDTAAALFPGHFLWRPPLDDLPAGART